ncbi:MAG: universal stress protein [Acidimicrobiales bacterium]|nr:universal stress protein [Acidimicrobiales bacterium]
MLPFALIVWLVVGAAVAAVMVRRGHNPAIWAMLVPYGPLAGLLALTARDAERDAPVEVHRAGAAGPGSVDVLVGVDGSEGSDAAAGEAVALLGSRMGRLVLACVVDYDADQLPTGATGRDRAAELVERAATALASPERGTPGTVVLTGRPATALADYARTEGFGLLAVGNRGHGAGHVLLGSVASRLAAHPDVPVLIAGTPPPVGETPSGTAP